MTTLMIYSIKSAIIIALLYIPYSLMLGKEKLFSFNRKILLCILVCSLTLPLLNLSYLSLDKHPVVHTAQYQMIEIGIPIKQQNASNTGSTSQSRTLSWFTLLSILYLTGMLSILILRVIQFHRMRKQIRGGTLWKENENGITTYCHMEDVNPFSWMNNIVISNKDYEANGREIILHEKGHILSHHSYDIILLTIVEIVHWWNPLIYLLRTSLHDVHEYEADDYVLRTGITLRAYTTLLIKKAISISPYTFANQFNHCQTKKRIKMMNKEQTNPWKRSKALYVFPVAFLALCAFATPKFTEPTKNAGMPSCIESSTSKLMITEASSPNPSSKDKINRPAEYPGGEAKLMEYLIRNIKYPDIATSTSIQGKVMVRFIVEEDGTLNHFETTFNDKRFKARQNETTVTAYQKEDLEKLTDSEKIALAEKALRTAAVRVLKATKKWNPAIEHGKKVRSNVIVPITFKLSSEKSHIHGYATGIQQDK